MRVYLNRFLNVPPVPLPKPTKKIEEKIMSIDDDSIFADPEALLKGVLPLLDKQQQVNQAGQLVIYYHHNNNGKPDRLLAVIGKALLREDRNFHSIQMIEAVFKHYSLLSTDNDNNEDVHILLVSAVRYLAAHSLTMRSQ